MDTFINRQEIKRIIESRTCNTHQEKPTVELTDKGLSLTTCCEPFKQALTDHIKDLSKEQAKNHLLNQFRGMFGRQSP
ncbi:MAG TPA: hypothetical protein PKA53_12990 [Sphingobacterium sp.]|nr:hypothetical protein [Sphingobacterium sp.]